MIRTGWFLVKSHDLVKLVDELCDRDQTLADSFQSLCEELAERYFTDRYPDQEPLQARRVAGLA